MDNKKFKKEGKLLPSTYQVQESKSRIDLPEYVPIDIQENTDDCKSQIITQNGINSDINSLDNNINQYFMNEQKYSTIKLSSSFNDKKREFKKEPREENGNYNLKCEYTESRDHQLKRETKDSKEHYKEAIARKRIRYHSRSPCFRSNSPHDKARNYRYGTSYNDRDRKDTKRGRNIHRSHSSKSNRSVFSRLGNHHEEENSPQKKSCVYYENDEDSSNYEPYSVKEISDERILYRNSDTSEDSLTRRLNIVVHCSEDYDRSRSVIYDNNQLNPAEIISAMRNLEFDQQELIQRCNDLKVKVEPIFREISSLETIILIKTQELEALKRKINYF